MCFGGVGFESLRLFFWCVNGIGELLGRQVKEERKIRELAEYRVGF